MSSSSFGARARGDSSRSVYVFQKLFGYSKEKATKLMLDVHHKGKAAVSSGNREQAETDVSRLHAHGLWATMQRD
jgi:ATP-dependent Clp protease adaptor protein ClpS